MPLSVDIQKKLGDFRLHVQFEAGVERLALLGASGCGKSVTLRCIAGIMTPDEGRIALDGVPLFDSAARINLPPQRRRVGYLFQQYALFPNMTAAQNIAAAVRDRAKREETVSRLLRQFQLEGAAGLRPGQLSGGQQQRAALARILASEPRVLLLDEPFSALDSFLKYQLETELSETLDRFSGPVVWVSHDRGEVFRNCKQVCVIDRGRSRPTQSLRELFHAPDSEAAARLSGCKNFARALPRGNGVYLPQWELTLDCSRTVPEGVTCIGVRAHFVTIADGPGANTFPCTVVRAVEDVFSTAVLLRPEKSAQDAPLLRMELEKMAWRAVPDQERLLISIRPRDILLFEE